MEEKSLDVSSKIREGGRMKKADYSKVSHFNDTEAPVRVNPLSANPTKWSNTLKKFVGSCRQIV